MPTDFQADGLDQILSGGIADHTLKAVSGWVADSSGVRYARAFGEAQPGVAMALDTPVAIMSMTKAVTGVAAMQLVEQGRLELDAPAGSVCPYLGEVQVLAGFDDAGQPQLRPPRQPLTLRHLLTHTSGFVYDLWNADMLRYAQVTGQLPLQSRKLAALEVPLLFDPGSRWEYGIGIDWVGLMVEAVTGQTLGGYLNEQVFAPLGMVDTTFAPSPDALTRQAAVYHRNAEGQLVLPDAPQAPAVAPEFEMGGGGLVSTVNDYGRFLRMLLGRGVLDGERVLESSTVQSMAQNHMGELRVTCLRSSFPTVSADAEFFPGEDKSWGLTFQISEQAAATGRGAGTLMWAGLTNCFYWIDLQRDMTGLFVTQLLPFADPQTMRLYYNFETAAYQSLIG